MCDNSLSIVRRILITVLIGMIACTIFIYTAGCIQGDLVLYKGSENGNIRQISGVSASRPGDTDKPETWGKVEDNIGSIFGPGDSAAPGG